MRQTWKAVLASHDVMARDTGGDGMRGAAAIRPGRRETGRPRQQKKNREKMMDEAYLGSCRKRVGMGHLSQLAKCCPKKKACRAWDMQGTPGLQVELPAGKWKSGGHQNRAATRRTHTS